MPRSAASSNRSRYIEPSAIFQQQPSSGRFFKTPTKMMRGNIHALVQVQAMGVVAMHARIEVELRAAQPPRFFGYPLHEQRAVTALAISRAGAEIIDVEVIAPGQAVGRAKPGKRR